MIGSLGFTEIAFILVLALLIFGPKRLPEIGRMVGKGLGEFRRASNDLKRTFNAEMSLADDEVRPKLTRAPRSDPKPTHAEGEAPATSISADPAAETVSRKSEPRSAPTGDVEEEAGEQTENADAKA